MSSYLTYILKTGEEIEKDLNQCQLHVGFEEYLMIKEYDGDLQAYEYQLVSKLRLHEQIDQIISIFEKKQLTNNEHSQEQQKLRVLELKNIVNKIICRFKTMQKDPQKFSKMQNMLHILGFEKKLLKILEHNNLKGDELILVYRIVQFMEFFSKNNPRHSWFLEEYFGTFLKIACPGINISKLATQMVVLNQNISLLQSNFKELLSVFVENFQFLLKSNFKHFTNEERKETHSKMCKSSDYLRVIVTFLCVEAKQFTPSFKTQFLDSVLRIANDLKLFNFSFFERVIEVSSTAKVKGNILKDKKAKIEKNLFYKNELLVNLLSALSLCTQQERNRLMLIKHLSIRDHFERQCDLLKSREPKKKKNSISVETQKTDFTTLFHMVRKRVTEDSLLFRIRKPVLGIQEIQCKRLLPDFDQFFVLFVFEHFGEVPKPFVFFLCFGF